MTALPSHIVLRIFPYWRSVVIMVIVSYWFAHSFCACLVS